MDRQLVYPAAIPQDSDLLSTNKNAMVALGRAIQDILGIGTVVAGLACTQTVVASLAVLIGPGAIYSLQNIDNSVYGSLAADTTDTIIKQGIQFGSVTIPTAAPPTAGQSINYLIEAQFQEVDTTPVVLPYYNSSNPQVPFSGPGNTGAPQNTQRKGTVVVQAKAGTAATTGTQTTPAPDSGFVGLYVVTVANGASSVTATNITTLPAAPFLQANLGAPTTSHLPSPGVTFISSTTLTNTPLSVNLAVGTYQIDLTLNFNGTTTGTQGIKFDIFGGTAVIGGHIGTLIGSVNAAAQNSSSNALSYATISVAATVDFLSVRFLIDVTTAGTFTIRGAQNSSSANATNLVFGSLVATKV